VGFFQEAAAPAGGAALFGEPLLPVAPGAQRAVPVPEGLDLDEPFFRAQEVPQAAMTPMRADPTDPYALAAAYKDDLGLMSAPESAAKPPSASPTSTEKSSLFYLHSKEAGTPSGGQGAAAVDAGAAAGAAPAAPADPLAQMREKLAAARAAGGAATRYEVLRQEVHAPGAPSGPAAGAAVGATAAVGSAALATPPEKELADLQGRLWAVCYSDAHIRVYFCVRAKSARKQQLRMEFRVERVLDAEGSDSAAIISGVGLVLPGGLSAQEADTSGVVALAAGALQARSPKAKVTLGLAPFLRPTACALAAEVRYGLAPGAGGAPEERAVAPVELLLPSTAFLVPDPMTQDEVAAFIAERGAELLGEQTAEELKGLAAPGRPAEALAQELPGLVGRCAGLCHFHGLQQQGQGQGSGQKFLLVARPPSPGASRLPGQEALPDGARIICMCAGRPREEALDLKITVKACRKDVADDVCRQLASTFRELVEGRLRA